MSVPPRQEPSSLQQFREFEYTRADFDRLRALSNKYSGILVPDDKFDMFYSRLTKRIRALRLNSFKEYCQLLEDGSTQEFTNFINSITTNLTAFFRENHHFDYLKKTVIPELIKKNQTSRQIRAWSAGCSTGEEAYSIAMTLLENLPAGWTAKILATDIDTQVLDIAANGVYELNRINGIPEEHLKRWFKKGTGSQINKVKVKPELRQMITFKQLNLMQDWPIKIPFDFIFCRNVFIYFDRETKKTLAAKYSNLLTIDSCLFIGHSESLQQVADQFELIGNTIYRKVG